MILGRTPAGLIKTKSDGGLRAVNCACCFPCGECFEILVPKSMRETLENATSASIWDFNTNEFYPNTDPEFPEFLWEMNARFPGPLDGPTNIFVEMGYSKNGCLYFQGYYFINGDNPNFPDVGAAFYGLLRNPEACVNPGETYETGTFSINGQGELPYWYTDSEGYITPPVPDIVFS